MELGQPEPIGALDDHHRRLGHVDADLDDRRPDEHVELAVAEPGHLGVAVGGLHPAVDEPDPERREQLRQADGLGLGGRRGRVEEPAGRGAVVGRLGLVDQRHDDERPVPERRLLREPAPTSRSSSSGRRMPVRIGIRPSGGVRRSDTSRSA